MTIKFNLTGLSDIYNESIGRSEPTIAFEINQGKGRFVFMMFFSEEDKESRDRLFVQLRNTKNLIKLKLYGSHRGGDFYIYFDEADKKAVIDELMLAGTGGVFIFEEFLEKINRGIPSKLPLQIKIDKIREIWPEVGSKLINVVDQADKVNLMGIKKLPPGSKPQDKTLRKLYIHTIGSASVITDLIEALKKANCTLAWTSRDVEGVSFGELMKIINS
ncbi:hypothetical protein [Xanthomonas campestris]|uniref:hypothetical protein n=2 Tax=Xanthomonas campestris TaxID=339 RepID=UPI0011AFBD15|nr:hypothetical protein [Xanthomonas campestris]MEB1261613.1 hypothetical protein [Xanthomonas campestris pv. campestris]MEB1323885.1 hypothetical protein [Xanthomonas campestris pv. campestris]MEB1357556.1 hypothetical protein [Xanthomonas campestris pv. campestris]MEB1423412.1 hypothetical protein [Xanthomonas campestris pv. campestris]MEB1448289.1 hypothetical protein [Xanthomonas campestris pv. campestris]